MDVFVARQPIFDRFRRTYAYELLFRSGPTNVFSSSNPDQASLSVIDTSFLTLGLDSITGGKPAFVNFTRDTLVNGYATILPKHQIVVEILEDVPPDDEVVDACLGLKAAGHRLALDDFVLGVGSERLAGLADIIKVDFLLNGPAERREVVRRFRPRGLKLLAEKVETPEDFALAMEAGYHYFQGYFFSKPVILSGKNVPASKLNLLRLLQEIHAPETDFWQIEALIKREVSLTYKLLKYMNTVAFGFRRIETVQHALMMLGESAVKRWVSVVALADMGLDKAFQLVVDSVVRAKFCEYLGARAGLGDRAHDLFLMGLFSMIDALLDRPLGEILEGLSLVDDVRLALVGAESPLRSIYDVARAYETGDWAGVSRLAGALALPEAAIPAMYLKSVEWGNSSIRLDART